MRPGTIVQVRSKEFRSIENDLERRKRERMKPLGVRGSKTRNSVCGSIKGPWVSPWTSVFSQGCLDTRIAEKREDSASALDLRPWGVGMSLSRLESVLGVHVCTHTASDHCAQGQGCYHQGTGYSLPLIVIHSRGHRCPVMQLFLLLRCSW